MTTLLLRLACVMLGHYPQRLGDDFYRCGRCGCVVFFWRDRRWHARPEWL